jgi:hypothetical protein
MCQYCTRIDVNSYTVVTAGIVGNIPAQTIEYCHCKWINSGDFCDLCHICWQLMENGQVASIWASALCHGVASIQTLRMFVKHASRGNPSLCKFCWHIIIYVRESHTNSRSCHSKQCHLVCSCCAVLHVSAWRWLICHWNMYKRTPTWIYWDDFWGFQSNVIEVSGFLHVTLHKIPEDGNSQISCYLVNRTNLVQKFF